MATESVTNHTLDADEEKRQVWANLLEKMRQRAVMELERARPKERCLGVVDGQVIRQVHGPELVSAPVAKVIQFPTRHAAPDGVRTDLARPEVIA